MALKKKERQSLEAALKKRCGNTIKTFYDFIIYISVYSPKCTIEEAVNIASWLREYGYISRD